MYTTWKSKQILNFPTKKQTHIQDDLNVIVLLAIATLLYSHTSHPVIWQWTPWPAAAAWTSIPL